MIHRLAAMVAGLLIVGMASTAGAVPLRHEFNGRFHDGAAYAGFFVADLFNSDGTLAEDGDITEFFPFADSGSGVSSLNYQPFSASSDWNLIENFPNSNFFRYRIRFIQITPRNDGRVVTLQYMRFPLPIGVGSSSVKLPIPKVGFFVR